MDRPWFKEAPAAPTAAGHLRALVHGSSAVPARVAPIMKVLDTAVAMDPEVAAEWTQDTDPRHVVHTAAARSLMAKPGARADVPPEQAADVLYGLLSPELYLLLAGARGWPPASAGRPQRAGGAPARRRDVRAWAGAARGPCRGRPGRLLRRAARTPGRAGLRPRRRRRRPA
ncbi:hypothetical protein ABZW11_19250 [Nonomuraea sp. NPDC004580]|uniref:hypothetical protein n=1 Tax=Nonomuraea sp. NPDC004580 TaxID=3154552 RepID=UPI00339DD461